MVYIIF